jgi:two-component system, NarL family, sensor histidine kinase DesK
VIWRWWSGLTGVERFDLTTRWPLYLVSASEPLIALLLILGQDMVRPWGAVALLLVTVLHTIACLGLLRAGIAHMLGGSRPGLRLISLTIALTAVGLVAGFAAFPAFGRLLGTDGFPVGLAVVVLFCGALTVAITPLLRGPRLVGVVVLPAILAGIVQAVTGNSAGQTSWALNYLLTVGVAVVTYRSTAWVLGLVWEIDRSRDAQARLAVAEERLRVARDLHDVLGRNLTLIAVNSGLAAELVRRGRDGAVEHMLDVRQLAQDSMREVREVVGGHRNATLDAELAGARSVLESAGVTVRVIGDGAGLPHTTQAALGWVVREAVTNVLRHSDPHNVAIELDVVQASAGGPAASLRIENDGVGTASTASSTSGEGTGLVGLRERLVGLGGELTAQVLPSGRFLLAVRLPLVQESLIPSSSEPIS